MPLKTTCLADVFKTKVADDAEKTYTEVLKSSDEVKAKRIEELKAALAIEHINLQKDSQSMYNSSAGFFRSIFGGNKLTASRMRMDATFKRYMDIVNELKSLGVDDCQYDPIHVSTITY